MAISDYQGFGHHHADIGVVKNPYKLLKVLFARGDNNR